MMACLWIASKVQEECSFLLKDMIRLARNRFTANELQQAELHILTTLQWNVTWTTSVAYFIRYCHAFGIGLPLDRHTSSFETPFLTPWICLMPHAFVRYMECLDAGVYLEQCALVSASDQAKHVFLVCLSHLDPHQLWVSRSSYHQLIYSIRTMQQQTIQCPRGKAVLLQTYRSMLFQQLEQLT
jgi:hypothetical protein